MEDATARPPSGEKRTALIVPLPHWANCIRLLELPRVICSCGTGKAVPISIGKWNAAVGETVEAPGIAMVGVIVAMPGGGMDGVTVRTPDGPQPAWLKPSSNKGNPTPAPVGILLALHAEPVLLQWFLHNILLFKPKFWEYCMKHMDDIYS